MDSRSIVKEDIFKESGRGSKIVDLRMETNHPMSLSYSEIYTSAILSAVCENGRSQPGFSLTGDSPFVIAAKKGLDYGIHKLGFIDKIFEVLEKYYNRFQPNNATEFLGLESDTKSELDKLPPWGSVFPWRARTIQSYVSSYEKAAIKENAIYSKNKGIEEGWLFCGPVSREKCHIEARRMEYILKQISQKGYVRSNDNDGDVKATALVNESGEWRWLITAGNHRASAAASLGYTEIPVRVNLVIRRQEADYWPHVVKGLYNKSNALLVFDSLFTGDPASDRAKKWKN